MSSILTNNSAMVALQTLKSVNANLAKTQDVISTGKEVATAKDNAAIFAISKVMESDVGGFRAIADSLSLGESTVAVAQNAAETISDLLIDIKAKVIAAQESNVDRSKIQTDIEALRGQIGSVAGAAQFNGLNLLSNRENVAGSGTVQVLSSLDRQADGSVSASNISVTKQDLGLQQANFGAGTAVAAGSGTTISGTLDAASAVALTGAATPPTSTLVIDSVTAGTGIQINISAAAGAVGTAFNDATRDVSYVARDGDTQADVANGLAEAFNARVASAIQSGTLSATSSLNASVSVASNGVATITFTGETGSGNNVSLQAIETTGVAQGGGLADLANLDVTSDAGATAALDAIEGLIQTAVDAAASFGSVRGRIETQSDFVTKLTDSLRSGIGALVDADLEEASARLQALQVQQQLATQSLSIANQAPQSILALFR